MVKRVRTTVALAILAMAVSSSQLHAEPGATPHNYKPEAGYVPDADTAIEIAVAVWEPIYGREQIAGEKPFTALLQNGVWIVEGSLPPRIKGGVARAEIAKDDGRVLRVTHGK
jgi:hypothetical protein